jgi:hypothetical protein
MTEDLAQAAVEKGPLLPSVSQVLGQVANLRGDISIQEVLPQPVLKEMARAGVSQAPQRSPFLFLLAFDLRRKARVLPFLVVLKMTFL